MIDAAPPFSIETVWWVEATYAPDAAETRVPLRARHLDRMARLRAQGIVVEVGAFTDVSASVLLIRAASEDDALELCRDDIYTRNGVWVELRARPFGRLRLDAEG